MLHACGVFLCFVSCETTYCCFVFLLQTKVALLFSVYCKRTVFCCGVVASTPNASALSNIAKRVISDKKQSARTERSINIGKKTIQVSNFHNAAETDVNLTGREQVLIQKSRCLFFDGKRHKIFENNFLNRTKYGLIFQKREKGFFF